MYIATIYDYYDIEITIYNKAVPDSKYLNTFSNIDYESVTKLYSCYFI